MKRGKAYQLAICGLFAGVTAVAAQIALPIGAVPISLATFSVFLAGILLGGKLGMISQFIYLLIGAVGLPVFAGFRGGLAVILGPTGGYIIGYVVAPLLIGLVINRGGRGIKSLILAVLVGWIANLFLGTAWYMILMNATLLEALLVCVAPFLVGDSIKMALAVYVGYKLYPRLSLKR